MAGIFVSYRRDDSQGFAGRLADDLAEILGGDRVFRDIEIPIGTDFTDVLQRAIAASDALLVVIGKHWESGSPNGHKSRLFEPNDWVRTEIEGAFDQGKQVVPVLVGGAAMPAAATLPSSIQRLCRMQAASMSDRRWDAEVAELAERLRAVYPSLQQELPRCAAQAESPSEVLLELGERLLDEVAARRRPRILSTSPSSTFMRRFICKLWLGLRRLLTIGLVLGLIYVGARLFGDQTLLVQLDAFEARLLIGWERLQQYFTRI